MRIENRAAIVTGSTKGIGLAIAESLIDSGANVVVTSRHSEDVESTVKRLNSRGSGKAVGTTCDVRKADDVKALVDFCVKELGGLDILVNNAGLGIFKEVEDLSLDDWRNTVTTNLDGVFYGCHYGIPEMKRRGAGFIINIGSLAGKNAFPGGAAYNASKFGLVGFSEALMQEIRHDDIQVAYIMPGSVDTWFNGKAPEGENSWKIAATDVAEVVVQTLTRDSRCLTSRIEMRPSKPPKK